VTRGTIPEETKVPPASAMRIQPVPMASYPMAPWSSSGSTNSMPNSPRETISAAIAP